MKRWLAGLVTAACFVAVLAGGLSHVKKAYAGVSCSVPFNLTNGTIADASQVMANYNAIIACLLNAAAAGANNDITALLGLTTPLSPTEGGSPVFVGGTSTGSLNAYTVATTTPGGFGLVAGYSVVFIPNFTNTATATLNVNGQGAVNLYKASGSGPQPLVGTEIVSGQIFQAYYDGAEFVANPFPLTGFGLSNGSQGTQINTTNPPFGFDTCGSLEMASSVTANILTIAVKNNAGNDPSVLNPVLCPFRDPTLANGDPVWIPITSALSINTNATGATLGSQNSVPFRFWLVAFDNAGTVVPALYNAISSTPTPQIFPIDTSSLQTSVPISNAATSAGVYYSPNGTTVTSKPLTILGNLEYSPGLGTAGTYGSKPTKLQLFGPGIYKPGEWVQTVSSPPTAVLTTIGGTQTQTAVAIPITPTNAIDMVEIEANVCYSAVASAFVALQISRGTTPTLIGNKGFIDVQGNTAGIGAVPLYATDFPAVTTPQIYYVFGLGSGGGAGNVNLNCTSIIRARQVAG